MASSAAPAGPPAPLAEREIDELQALLDAIPPPWQALDVSMLDGFLVGVLLQPRPVPPARWLPFVTDDEGRPLPRDADLGRLHALVRRRHAELDRAIAARQWFDPWIFEADAGAPGVAEDPVRAAVAPWVTGFAAAASQFPALLDLDEAATTEPLALLLRHLDPEELEDADALLEEIESLEPPADLAAAVEELVRGTLLLADVSRPVPKPKRAAQRPRR